MAPITHLCTFITPPTTSQGQSPDCSVCMLSAAAKILSAVHHCKVVVLQLLTSFLCWCKGPTLKIWRYLFRHRRPANISQ